MCVCVRLRFCLCRGAGDFLEMPVKQSRGEHGAAWCGDETSCQKRLHSFLPSFLEFVFILLNAGDALHGFKQEPLWHNLSLSLPQPLPSPVLHFLRLTLSALSHSLVRLSSSYAASVFFLCIWFIFLARTLTHLFSLFLCLSLCHSGHMFARVNFGWLSIHRAAWARAVKCSPSWWPSLLLFHTHSHMHTLCSALPCPAVLPE